MGLITWGGLLVGLTIFVFAWMIIVSFSDRYGALILSIVCWPFIALWPTVMVSKIYLWLREAEWPDWPVGMGLSIEGGKWRGLDAIFNWLNSVDVTWYSFAISIGALALAVSQWEIWSTQEGTS